MIGTELANRYVLVGELGRGGMGVVYRAQDPLLEREVAVKVLFLTSLSKTAEDRFRREAQVVAQMDHPSIVPIYDVGRHEESLFFVMPVVEGTTMQELIRGRSLLLGEILEIVAQVAEALDYSHAQGVVHRDIKPENIMVEREDHRIRARIMDFGLALDLSVTRLTKTGNLPGTLAYLSPEQIKSDEVDGRSDLYSLGTILHECLAGAPPFGGSRYALLYRIAHESPPSLAKHGVDEALQGIVSSCLAKEADLRPQRGNELAARLRHHRDLLSDASRRREVIPESPRLRPARANLPLIGRRNEMAELRRRLELSLTGECQLVILGGEAGMGKSRLLREIEDLAKARGLRVLRGHFADEESAFSYQGFGELLQDYFRERGDSHSSQADRMPDFSDLAADLLTLFPALGEIPALREAAGDEPPLLATAGQGDRAHVFELLARTLLRLAGGQPLVLLVENLHSADASLEALQYVVRRLGPARTLVLGTYRPNEISRQHSLSRLRRRFQGDSRFVSLMLGPLDADDHRDLVKAVLSSRRVADDLCDRLYSATEGNPFFCQELIRSLLENDGIAQDPSGAYSLSGEAAISSQTLPETIQQAVEARLERLPEPLLRTLSIAAVLGRSFDFQDLQELVDELDVDEAVEELIRGGLLEEDPHAHGDQLVFTSGVVRDVIYGELSRRRRRRLHRRHAEHLERRWADQRERVFPRLVHHFAAGDVPAKTMEYALKLAREQHALFGSDTAIRAIRTALELVEDDEMGSSMEGELRLRLAHALRTAGQLDNALKEAGKAARALQRAADAETAAEASWVAAEIAWQERKVADTRSWVDRGIEMARLALVDLDPDKPRPVAATLRRLLTLGATVANLRSEYVKARAFLEEVEAWSAAQPETKVRAPVGGDLVASLSGSPTTRDPTVCRTLEDAEVLANVFEPLLTTDPDGNLVPALARAWEGSPDGTAFDFTLRPDARFSDGTPVTAREVRRSFSAALRRAAGPVAGLDVIVGAAAVRSGAVGELEGVEVVDELLVRFRLADALPIFPALTTDLRTAIAIEREGELLGTGPFRFAGWEPRSVVLERNPGDYRAQPSHLDRLEFRVIPDPHAIAAGLRSGEIDIGTNLAPEDLDSLLREPRFRSGLVETTAKSVFFVLFHHAGRHTRDPRVRDVLAHTVRLEDVVWRTLGRFAKPATGLLPPSVLGHQPTRRCEILSRDEASEVLRRAGAGDRRPLVLRAVLHPLFTERYASLARALFEEWKAVGIEVDVVGSTRDDLFTAHADPGDVDLFLMRWVPSYDDPDAFLGAMFHPERGTLRHLYTSAEIGALLEEARHEVRPAMRQALYAGLEERLAESHVVLPLFYDVAYRLASPRVGGLRLLDQPPYVDYAALSRDLAASAESPAPRRGSVLRVPLPLVLDSLDPAHSFLVDRAEVTSVVFETLTRVADDARIVPHLAAEVQALEGSRRFHFRLQKDVRFHDGRLLSSRDVRYTFERLLRVLDPWLQTMLLPIRGARDLAGGHALSLAGLRILDDHELTIDIERPLVFFPAMLSNPTLAIVPEGCEDFSGGWQEGCAGTGPFRVCGTSPERIELEASPGYWRAGFPKSERLVFEAGAAPSDILEGIRAGRFSLAGHLRPADVEELHSDPELAAGFRISPGFSTYFLALNTRSGPFADRRWRHALRDLIEPNALVPGSVGRLGIPAHGLIPPGLSGYESLEERRSSASSSSRPDLEMGLDPNDLRGSELRVAVLPTYLEKYRPLWDELCRIFDRHGIGIEVISGSTETLLASASLERIDLVAARWIAVYPDTDYFYSLLHSTGFLHGLVSGEDLDKLLDRGRRETDPALRHTIYRDLEQHLARQALLVPLFHEQVYRFARPEVRGLRLGLGLPEVPYEELET